MGRKRELKPSEQVAQFLNFVDQCERSYQMAFEEVNKEDKRVQDLLHQVEFAKGAAARNQAAAKLQKSRRWRRENKDTVLYYKSIVEFFGEKGNRNTLNQMRQMLGRQRKEEEYQESDRTYTPQVEKTA